MADLAPLRLYGHRIGAGAQRARSRLAAKLAAHPPLNQGEPSRQVIRRGARKAAKAGIASAKKAALKARRNSRPKRAS